MIEPLERTFKWPVYKNRAEFGQYIKGISFTYYDKISSQISPLININIYINKSKNLEASNINLFTLQNVIDNISNTINNNLNFNGNDNKNLNF